MDAKALRATFVVLSMFTCVAAVIFIARSHIELSQDDLSGAMQIMRGSIWALPITIVIFTAAAFIGIPQWLLIAAAVLAFGPSNGAIYAWLATMISASFDFWLARRIGAQRIEALSGAFLARIITLVRRNGFLTSFAVRLVPTGPFILVNMAAGVSGLNFAAFISGTAIGIIPKILVVALLGQGALTAAQGETFMFMAVVGALLIVGLMLVGRRVLRPVLMVKEKSSK